MAADDPRERLRRYLEQRRETGESELLLDSLEVGEVMRMLGAAQSGVAAGPTPRTPSAPAESAPVEPRAVRAPDPFSGDSDWRAALRAAGAAPSPAPVAPRLEVRGSIEALVPPSISSLDSLEALAAATGACTRCPLYATATNPVPGEGNPNADFMIVGEAPGATEDATGRPFVGQAGQLLTRIIGAINLSREDVFIANVLKHRPPGNRNPAPDEVVACSPYLLRQIELVRPKVILALGTFAAQTLLETKLAIGKLRGQVHSYHGVPLIVTYHPAALLRNSAWKRPTWEDVQLARRVLDSASGA